MKNSRLATALAVIFGTVLLTTPARAQASDTTDVLLRSLIEEIRALRLTMQRSAGYDLRARVLLDRARLQQEIVRELEKDLNQRALNRGAMMDEQPMEQMVEQFTEQLRTETDPERRREIEHQMQMMRRQQQMHARHLERMRLQEQQMENRLAEEKAKLDEIQRALMALEAELSAAEPRVND